MTAQLEKMKPTERRVRAYFRKTEFCRFFEAGRCLRGDECDFAHGGNELKTTPDLTKTAMCKAWAQGQCNLPRGQCAFAHGKDELRNSRDEFRKSQINLMINDGYGEAELRNLPDLTKTILCRSWKRKECPLTSEECPFAHGREEIGIRMARLKKCLTRPALQGSTPLPQRQQDVQGPKGNSNSIPDGVTKESKVLPEQMVRLIGVARGPVPKTLCTEASIPFTPVVMIDPGFLHSLLVKSMPDHYED